MVMVSAVVVSIFAVVFGVAVSFVVAGSSAAVVEALEVLGASNVLAIAFVAVVVTLTSSVSVDFTGDVVVLMRACVVSAFVEIKASVVVKSCLASVGV